MSSNGDLTKPEKRPRRTTGVDIRIIAYISSHQFWSMTVLLSICVVCAFLLSLANSYLMSLPGCRAGSSCYRILHSRWAFLPGIPWPVSFLGLSYFLSLLLVWIWKHGQFPFILRVLIRVGAAASFGFTCIMIFQSDICIYCLLTHAANLAFWMLSERMNLTQDKTGPVMAGFLACFILSTLLLVIVQ
jgi:uncharacterized membrane protein